MLEDFTRHKGLESAILQRNFIKRELDYPPWRVEMKEMWSPSWTWYSSLPQSSQSVSLITTSTPGRTELPDKNISGLSLISSSLILNRSCLKVVGFSKLILKLFTFPKMSSNPPLYITYLKSILICISIIITYLWTNLHTNLSSL